MAFRSKPAGQQKFIVAIAISGHISHEGGELEDAGNAPLATTWQITRSPQEAPDREEQVTIGFAKGTPISVNGMGLDPVQLVELLNRPFYDGSGGSHIKITGGVHRQALGKAQACGHQRRNLATGGRPLLESVYGRYPR